MKEHTLVFFGSVPERDKPATKGSKKQRLAELTLPMSPSGRTLDVISQPHHLGTLGIEQLNSELQYAVKNESNRGLSGFICNLEKQNIVYFP